MKRLTVLIIMLLAAMPPASGGAQTPGPAPAPPPVIANSNTYQKVLIEKALECLPEANPFGKRAGVQSKYRYGVPYFFGGRDPDRILETMGGWDNHKYYAKGIPFLGGFDCAGYLGWVYSFAGLNLPTISAILSGRMRYGEYIDVRDIPVGGLHRVLDVGDLIAEEHIGGYHLLMVIGTLRGFGFSRLSDEMLDRPLVAHCTSVLGNDYYLNYSVYIRENGLVCKPPAGGCVVSILGETEEAPQSVGLKAWQTARRYGAAYMSAQGEGDGGVFELTFYPWSRWEGKRVVWRPLPNL
ncbi:MAG: hypothetical protein FWF86_06060 [Clostridia bacterium]|nr:hypothetical protein [Clostridia bacterium]